MRKKTSAFIEKVLRFLGYEFEHDGFKEVVYAEREPRNQFEEKCKQYYDAYMFLLNSRTNRLSVETVVEFFSYFGLKDIKPLANEISGIFDIIYSEEPLERAIKFYLEISPCLSAAGKDEGEIVPLMLFNYSLVESGIPSVRFTKNDFDEYKKCKSLPYAEQRNALYGFFKKSVFENELQDKSYYKNLIPLTAEDIVKAVRDKKKWLTEELYITHIGIYGSFASGKQRIDSDIDFVISMSMDIPYEERAENAKKMGDYFFSEFKRFTDICEEGAFCNSEIRKELKNKIDIF